MCPLLADANPTDAATLMSIVAPDTIASDGITADFDTISALIYDNLNDMGYKIAEVGACTGCVSEATGAADSLDNYDLTGDASVTDLCGFVRPADETEEAHDDTTEEDHDDHEDHDHDEDDGDDDEDCKENPMGMILMIVGIIALLIGLGLCVMSRKSSVSPA